MGASEEPREASAGRWKAVCASAISRLVQPDAGRRAHGCRWCVTPCRTTIVRATVMPLSRYRQRPWVRSTDA